MFDASFPAPLRQESQSSKFLCSLQVNGKSTQLALTQLLGPTLWSKQVHSSIAEQMVDLPDQTAVSSQSHQIVL